MATPDFILSLRERVGHELLWLIGVTAVVLKGDDVLLVRRTDNGRLTPVTGIVDPGEEPAVAAEREVLEEADVVASTEALVWVRSTPPMTYENGDRAQYLDIVLRCRWESGEPRPADGENTEAFWWPVAELAALSDMSDDMRARVRQAVSGGVAVRFER
ncbi:NUDIX hydrolase [Microbacterium marinilacus]|uniref:NUDIX domain-containing protein n=1 Tax=Microbacterium marinilacus TaxID=415209 RepID=A0ABP7B862_9MICO|nr:NUDIX domain-containing protein [Microbacterium marinilacus]MBY0687492.1 NUDIX domain-containing protein [Microbacterium marinilacus]